MKLFENFVLLARYGVRTTQGKYCNANTSDTKTDTYSAES